MKNNRIILLLLLGMITFSAVAAQSQEIMSYEEYQQIEHSEPYIVHLQPGTGELLYFGSRHSFDPGDPQFEKLKKHLEEYQPGIIYSEGYPEDVSNLSMEEAIKRFGEFGVTWKWANEQNIDVRSLEPERQKEVSYLREKNWTDEHIILYYTLRQVSQSNQQQVTLDFDKLVPEYLASLEQRFGLKGPDTIEEFENVISDLLPDVDNWKEISLHYFYPGLQDSERYTNRISTDSNQYRDQQHAKLITEAVNDGKRVFAIVGSAHVVMQEPALRSMLK